ncbi:MAG: IPT/TIG domain-containing protein, partial [Actinomycetota bacterium]
MVRRLALVSMVLFLFAGVSTASAAPLQLTLPQGDAFSILGYSCGGIQEQVYASGFDAATGYPDGYASLSTRCGGSGRGGGYRTTTYTAWAAVSWDFTGAVVSYARTTSVAVNPTLDVFDAHGNELSNTSGQALLTLAAGFVPSARVVSVSPSSGPAAGGTTVTIAGTGFTGATGVRFGTVAAKSLTVTSSTSITAVAPAAPAGTVDVTVTNAGGVSAPVAADQFTFVAAPVVSAVSPKSGPVAG